MCQKSTATRSKRRLTGLRRLRWTTPSSLSPHGVSGALSVVLGAFLVVKTLRGELEAFSKESSAETIPVLLSCYAGFTILSSTAGFRLSKLAQPNTRNIFRRCAILQISMCYFIGRFLPHFTSALKDLQSTVGYDLSRHIQIMDGIMAGCLVLCILSFNGSIVGLELSPILSFSIVFGSIGLMLLAAYPLQLSYFGQDWWTCVQERYPMQAPGMVAFIYVPATLTFSIMLFGATLYQRGIIDAIEYGIGSTLFILVCLVATVLHQEIHIPDVSTQRIYLPCQEPLPGSFEAGAVKAMDFSRYARNLLQNYFGVEFETQLYKD